MRYRFIYKCPIALKLERRFDSSGAEATAKFKGHTIILNPNDPDKILWDLAAGKGIFIRLRTYMCPTLFDIDFSGLKDTTVTTEIFWPTWLRRQLGPEVILRVFTLPDFLWGSIQAPAKTLSRSPCTPFSEATHSPLEGGCQCLLKTVEISTRHVSLQWIAFEKFPSLYRRADNTDNRPISQCTRQISHNAGFCNRNVHIGAHFCYKMLHCGIWGCWDLRNRSILEAMCPTASRFWTVKQSIRHKWHWGPPKPCSDFSNRELPHGHSTWSWHARSTCAGNRLLFDILTYWRYGRHFSHEVFICNLLKDFFFVFENDCS